MVGTRCIAFLREFISKNLHLNYRRDLLVQNIVNRLQNRHFNLEFLVDLFHAFRCVIAFSDHIHFQLRCFYRISFPDHETESPVAREFGISRNQ